LDIRDADRERHICKCCHPRKFHSLMTTAFVDYYRCPSELATIETMGSLSAEQGFFRFRKITCFGRCVGATPSPTLAGNVPTIAPDQKANGVTRLPFDLTEVAGNLRQEQYVSNGRPSIASRFVRTAYYIARPLLPVKVRKHLQKARLSDWKDLPFPAWPVDLSVDSLMKAAMTSLLQSSGVDRVPFIWFWPDGAPSCAILTHDIETARGRDFCRRLMDINDEYGLKASFQVVPERRYDGIESLCSGIRDRGFEVNVHDLNHDGHLFEDRKRFDERVDRINEYARAFRSRGFRAAAMYRNQRWFDQFEFCYDMSVPNVAHLEPQRGGCCTVMPFFVGGLVELPLTTIQDYSLFNILGQYSTAIWEDQIERLIAANGLITLLSHPDYLIEARAQATYRELLAHVSRLRAAGRLWFALPSDVERWWRDRSRMRLVRNGHAWHIEGSGAERATVAYARLEHDALVLELD